MECTGYARRKTDNTEITVRVFFINHELHTHVTSHQRMLCLVFAKYPFPLLGRRKSFLMCFDSFIHLSHVNVRIVPWAAASHTHTHTHTHTHNFLLLSTCVSFTFPCRPRCTVPIFNSLHAAYVGAPCLLECF